MAMADANLHLEIGPQYVEAAKLVVEKAVAPFRSASEYDIAVNPKGWLYVEHNRCGKGISSTAPGQRLGVDALLRAISEHECPGRHCNDGSQR